MYRKLKNILGVSLMVLAIVIAQLPMPKTQAEIANGETETNDNEASTTHTVTFHMNGGTFNGDYNGYQFQNQTPVLIVDDGAEISSFPDEKYMSYTGYHTEKDIWFTDRNCLNEYDKNSTVTEDLTLYKKWYNITSDGATLSDKGFHISADGTVLYRYDGGEKHVKIPQTITTIAEGAFDSLGTVRGITLPEGIETIEENAFSRVEDGNIIYIYDSGTDNSKEYGRKLADTYEQLVYSEYLDIEDVAEIAGIDYQSESETEEFTEESTQEFTEESTEETSKVIVVEPDEKYTVTFDTGISDVDGEEREVLSGRTISELVSIDQNQPKILEIGKYQIERDDGKQEITYTFQGWYKDKDYTQKWDFANDVIEDHTIIYAKWDKQTRAYFYVTYSAQGADNVPEKQKLYEDEALEKPSRKPSIKNKTFLGWYTDPTEDSTEYKSWGSTITEDLTLYAHFEEKSYTVVFHMNGGGFTGTYNGTSYTDAASLKTKVTVGNGIASSDYPESDTSSSFKYSSYSTDSNWYKDKECLNTYSRKNSSGSDTVLSGDLTLYKKWYYTSSGFTMNAAGNVLYKYSGNVAEVTIPQTVTMIGPNAFSSAGSISTITLPDNISEVKDNAFSGVNNISKDITITGKTENAIKVAKELASEYTHLVYKDSRTDESSSSSVNVVESGSIKLGATISGSTGSTDTGSSTSGASTATSSESITIGANTVNLPDTTGTANAATDIPAVQGTQTNQQTAVTASGTVSGSSAAAVSGSTAAAANTTQKKNTTSASAPRSTEHVKDSTPKTGDPLQYRMLFICVMFSAGALLVLTGNGKKRKASAS